MNPTVSIITALYNSMPFIEETIQSVLSQSFTDFEWIIVDGHSTDGCYEVVEEYVKKDSRIKLYLQKNNVGAGAARNEALDIACGDYITFLDADDMYDPNFLERQLEFVKDNGPFICSSYRRLSAGETSDYIVPDEMTYKSLLKGNPIAPLTAMYDRRVFEGIRFQDKNGCEDYVMFLRMLKKEGITCRGNKEVLATYRIHEGSMSASKFFQAKCHWRIYKDEGIGFFKRIYYMFCWAVYGLKKYKGVKRKPSNYAGGGTKTKSDI